MPQSATSSIGSRDTANLRALPAQAAQRTPRHTGARGVQRQLHLVAGAHRSAFRFRTPVGPSAFGAALVRAMQLYQACSVNSRTRRGSRSKCDLRLSWYERPLTHEYVSES
jgi:hypothetical protein